MPRCFSWAGHRLPSLTCVPCTGDAAGRPCSPSSPSSHAAETSMSLRHRGDGSGSVAGRAARKFTLEQLSAATDGFSASNLLGQGGFGRVYRCHLRLDNDDDEAAAPTPVAVKQLCRGGAQGSREFVVECAMLMTLRHPNLVSLVGYCAQAQERLLVYELLPRGSLDAHLFRPLPAQGNGDRPALEWNTRVKIAHGAARALRYLHEAVSPPVIYRDLKPSNILLADDFTAKLSDLGLARIGPSGDDTHVSTRVMGTLGYCAPDYALTGRLTVKSDVYSFGVVLLELITGRRAFDPDAGDERRLLDWARPYLGDVRKMYGRLADPALRGRFPRRALYQLAVVASLCLHDRPNLRPTMSDVTRAIDHVASQPWQAHHRAKSCQI
ncbi:probable serine/threonine-protein kinase PBL7 [Triticum urartu]|nr:probable serine/threonine-protein kinase PBL7 [Triticum urartu]